MTTSAAYERTIHDDRQDWKLSVPNLCMVCRVSKKLSHSLDIHEIERRSHARGRWGVRCNYLLACSECHMSRLGSMPHAKQLALKLTQNGDDFDLENWLRIRDPDMKSPERVTLQDIARHLEVIVEF